MNLRAISGVRGYSDRTIIVNFNLHFIDANSVGASGGNDQ